MKIAKTSNKFLMEKKNREVLCGGVLMACNMDCMKCPKSNILYSNSNSTTNTGSTITIFESPKHNIYR